MKVRSDPEAPLPGQAGPTGSGTKVHVSHPPLLVYNPGAVPFDVADRMDQGIADGCFPGLHPLERTQDLCEKIPEERPHFLLHLGLGSLRIVRAEQMVVEVPPPMTDCS